MKQYYTVIARRDGKTFMTPVLASSVTGVIEVVEHWVIKCELLGILSPDAEQFARKMIEANKHAAF